MSWAAAEVAEAVDTFVERLRERLPVTAVLLFGSRARGDWLTSGDVDILVLSTGFEQMPYLARLERLALEWAERSDVPADPVGGCPLMFHRLVRCSD